MSFFERLPGSGYICAHRGARSTSPENTFLALTEARKCGADLWEADIQFSADGEPVIFHDDVLDRTSDVAERPEFAGRKPWAVADFSLSELQSLNVGRWFAASDPYGTIASGEVEAPLLAQIADQRISRLEDVLRYCRDHDFPFNLEIKDQHGRLAAETVAQAVLERLQRFDMEELTLVSSFNHDYLRHLKKQNPRVATAALVEDAHPPELIAYLADLEVEAYHPDWRITDAELIGQLREAGIRTNLWTVNDMDRAEELSAAGATFICTDWPQRLAGRRHSA
jgi:glycerophosphoryl diester phosphodiesterase